MIALQLRNDSESTRIFCKNCFWCIAIDHVNYQSNVSIIQLNYIEQTFNIECPLKAVINLIVYPVDSATLGSDKISVFHTIRLTQERKFFINLSNV